MPKKAFFRIFAAIIKKVRYFYKTSIYAVRQNLSKKVDGKLYFSKSLLASLLSSLRPTAFAVINWLTLCLERYNIV
jgi:energy-converting hydrogenase Eha subunit F